jgi:hypothetical protein
VPLLDDRVAADMEVRDHFFETFGGLDFVAPPAILAARLARAFAGNPAGLVHGARWLPRFVARAGGLRELRRNKPRAMTFVMHNFMDAADVKPAWELLQRGEMSDEPRIRATQERLQACSYAMAHPEDGRLVPACAQHSVLDPEENRRLARELPLARGVS